MSFAKEGYVFIGIAMGIAAVAFAGAIARRSFALWLAAFILTLLALWVAYFFRDPERAGARGDRLVVSPADGKVIMITEVNEPAFMAGPSLRVSVFMNVFDVHVNRYPVNGTVAYLHYNEGKFINAAHDKASLDNEQMSVGIETNGHRVLTRQIAGLIARRIVTYSKPGEIVTQGARMGLIRFGSRVDVFVPVGSTPLVQVGDRATAGVTVLAELPE